jgi:hypothetical protein
MGQGRHGCHLFEAAASKLRTCNMLLQRQRPVAALNRDMNPMPTGAAGVLPACSCVCRFFDGSLAHLMLLSHGLEPEAVAGLYTTYRQNGTNASGGDGWLHCLIGVAVMSCPAQPPQLNATGLRC